MENLEKQLLQTLSFFDPMNLEKIILDFDTQVALENPDLNQDVLLKHLAILVNKRLVTVSIQDGEQFWIKRMKKRTIWRRIVTFFK